MYEVIVCRVNDGGVKHLTSYPFFELRCIVTALENDSIVDLNDLQPPYDISIFKKPYSAEEILFRSSWEACFKESYDENEKTTRKKDELIIAFDEHQKHDALKKLKSILPPLSKSQERWEAYLSNKGSKP
jgi:type IV secretory pathway VirB4 component